MKIEQQVCSLELAKKLKDLGLNYESYYSYCFIPENFRREGFSDDSRARILPNLMNGWHGPKIETYTVAELGELINQYENSTDWHSWKCINSWSVCYVDENGENAFFDADTEANARAMFLIFLLDVDQS